MCSSRFRWLSLDVGTGGTGTHLLTEADQHAINVMLLDGLLLTSLANIPSFCLWACILVQCSLCQNRMQALSKLARLADWLSHC